MVLKKNSNTLSEKNRSLVSHYQPKSPISEQFRTIRTNLQYALVDKELKTVMVTSATPGDGKSTVTANLAVVMAQQGKRILLIDADLRKPTAHYTFRCPNTQGLTSILTKQATLKEAVQETDIDNLSIISSGPVPPNPSELLSSAAMEQLLQSALEAYDMVVVDTPPILAVTDALVLSQHCDGSVLVIGSGKTEVEQAVKAKELLEKSSAKLMGAVLNRKKEKVDEYYYYYGDK